MAASTKSDGRLGSSMTFFMQVTFNTSGSVILMPWTFATLGFVFGPIAMICVFGITLQAQYFLNAAAIAQRDGAAATLRELAERMGGRRLGDFAALLQGANMLLVMPAELNVAATALQYVVNARPGSLAHCNIIYVLIMAVPAVLVTQFVRKFGHKTGTLAGISFMIIGWKCCLIIYSIVQHADLYASDAAPMVGMGEAAKAAGTYHWANVVSALGNFWWSFAPVFLNTELVAEMRHPEQVHRQLFLAAACLVVLYTAVGTVGATYWGVSAQDPINLQLPYDWAGVAVNCLIMYGAWLDYLISEIVFTGYLQQMFEPGFDRADFSAGACGRWLLYSLPGNLCALGLISFVPRLETLVGVISATCITLASFALPALAGLHWGRRSRKTEGDAETAQQQGDGTSSASSSAGSDTRGVAGSTSSSGASHGVGVAPSGVPAAAAAEMQKCVPEEARLVPALKIHTCLELGQWLIALLGVASMVGLVASSVSFILATDYGGESFFCDVVG